MANEFIIRKGYKSLASSEVTGSLTLIGNYESIRALTINSTKGSGTEHYFRTHGVNGDTLAIYSGGSRVLSVDSNSIDVLGSISGSTYYGDGTNLTGVLTSLNGAVLTTGDQTVGGVKTFTSDIHIENGGAKLYLKDTTDDDDQAIYFVNNGNTIEYVIATQDFTGGGLGDGMFIGSVSSDPLVLATANTAALTIDTSQNATFSGNITLTGGGTIQTDSTSGGEDLALKAAGHVEIVIDSNSNGADDQFFKVMKHTNTELFSVKETGLATVTGDLTVTGTVTAQEFHTEYVSASIVYQSGSTKFGDTSDDNHDFTGSINLTGSMEIRQTVDGSGLVIRSSNVKPEIRFIDDNASQVFGIGYNRSGNHLVIDHGNTPRIEIAEGGQMTLNTINQAASDTDKFLVSDSGAIKYRSGSQVLSDIGAAASSHNHNDLYFTETESDARYLRLTGGTMSGAIDFHQTDTEDIIITGNSSASNANQFFIKHNFGNVDIGNLRGNIRFISGSVSVGTANSYAKLSVAASSHNTGISVNRQADTTAAIYIGNDGGNNPILAANNADMIFGRDLSGTFTEYMRIENGGNVGIGTNNPDEKLDVNGTARFRGTIEGVEATTLIKDVITDQTYEGTAFYNPETINAFAGANKWATVTVSNAKSSDRTTAVTDVGAAPFMVGGSTFQPYFDTSETEIVIEIDHTAEPLRYHGIVGIQFTNTAWRAERVKIEGYNGSSWTTGVDTTTNVHGTVVAKLALGSAGVQKTKITLGNPANSSGGYMRISKIFGYDYKGVSSYDSTKSGTYYLEKFSDSGHYGTIFPAADSTYDLGTNTLRYANIYADTLHGSVTTATTASNAMLLDGIDSTAFLRSDANDDFSGTLNYTPDTGTILSVDGQAILQRMTANGAITIGHDDAVIIAGGDTSTVLNTNINNAAETVYIGAEGGLVVYGFPNNDTTWSNRQQFTFSNDGKIYLGTASDTNLYRSAANTLKTDDAFHSGGNITANGSILGGGNLFLRSYNNDPKGIFFRDGFEYGDTNQYNLSITIYDDGDGAADGMNINAYDGIYFNVQSGATPSTKFRVLNSEVRAYTDLYTSGDLTVSGGDITLGGTGRIQGIDTVSANTDAANKLYVDNAVAGGASAPNAPTSLTTSIVGNTVNVGFTASTTSDIDLYLVFSSVSGSDYSLISVIPPDDFGSTMSIIDDSFDESGVQAYRVYAQKNGAMSSALTGNITYSVTTPLEPTNMSVVNLNTAYYIQWDPPSSNARFVTAYNVYKHEHSSQASLSRSSATLIYSGMNTSYMYQINGNNNLNFHQFWVETTVA